MTNAFSTPKKGVLAFCAAFFGPATTDAGTYYGKIYERVLPMLLESNFVSCVNKASGAEIILNIKPGKYLVSLVGICTDGRYPAKIRMLDAKNVAVLESNLDVNTAQVLPFAEIYLDGQYRPQVFRQKSGYSSAGIITICKN